MKISIVVTVYNIEKYIKKCIESLKAQTYDNIEIIVVDDCSPDKSMTIVEEMKDSRFVIIHNKENVGAGLSRRYGIQHSTGEYVMLVDGDDWIETDCIKKLVDAAIESNADIASCGVRVIYSDTKIENFDYKTTGECYGIDKLNIERCSFKTVMFLNNKIVRRALYDKVEYCGSRFIEDVPTEKKLLYYANKVKYIDFCGYNYCKREGSLTAIKDKVRYFIYTTLAIIDSIKFFEDKEEEWRAQYDYNLLRGQMIAMRLNGIKEEEIAEKYPSEYKEVDDYIQELRDRGIWKN